MSNATNEIFVDNVVEWLEEVGCTADNIKEDKKGKLYVLAMVKGMPTRTYLPEKMQGIRNFL